MADKKEALSFLHDSNARDDMKIIGLRLRYGNNGHDGMAAVGVYWSIVEMMRETKGYKLKLKDSDKIEFKLQPTKIKIKQFIENCLDCEIDLFKSDGEYFWSDSLLNRMKKYDEWKRKKSEAGIKGNEIRWGKKRKNKENIAQRSQCDNNGIATNIIEENIKDDKITELKRIYNSDVYINVVVEVLKYLNMKTGRNFSLLDEYVDEMVSRQKKGAKLSDFIHVIDVKLEDKYFIDNPQYMNPETLFRQPNFDRYKNQKIEDFKNKPKPGDEFRNSGGIPK
jgi:uncharacterized phage protein (TIGR02220 family)